MKGRCFKTKRRFLKMDGIRFVDRERLVNAIKLVTQAWDEVSSIPAGESIHGTLEVEMLRIDIKCLLKCLNTRDLDEKQIEAIKKGNFPPCCQQCGAPLGEDRHDCLGPFAVSQAESMLAEANGDVSDFPS
jgi:hypothetical protein